MSEESPRKTMISQGVTRARRYFKQFDYKKGGKKGRNDKALMSRMPKIPDQFLRDVSSAGFFTARLLKPEEINLFEHEYRSKKRHEALI